MKSLDIFLTALEEIFSDKGIYFIKQKVSLPSRFPAYTELELKIYAVHKEEQTLISRIKQTGKTTTKEEKEKFEEDACVQSIKNVLNYYGI